MSLFSALDSTANTLSVFQNALSVVQNNVNNASTPGYAAQSATFEALPYEQGTGLLGGVTAGQIQDSRNAFAEANVQSSAADLGYSQQQVQSLTAIQNLFDISGQTGIAGALSNLYSAFSAWSSAPASATEQQGVLRAAANVAKAFQQTAAGVAQTTAQTNGSIHSTVEQINQLAAQIAGDNAKLTQANGPDSGVSSDLYNRLQQLSQLVNFTAVQGSNGVMNVLLGNGQTPIVDGSKSSALTISTAVVGTANPNAPASTQILDSTGRDITSEISGGRAAALLNVANVVLPSLQGDGSQTGSLNQLAQGMADRINALLSSGQVSAGPPAVPGVPLFTYNNQNATAAASSLQLNPAITASTLAAGDANNSNNIALTLAGLANSQNPADQINGLTYTEFYGTIASGVGSQLSAATSNQSEANDALTQAESVRQQISGVDLNEQAAQIIQFQQAFNAASKVITVVDSMLETVLNLVTASQVV